MILAALAMGVVFYAIVFVIVISTVKNGKEQFRHLNDQFKN